METNTQAPEKAVEKIVDDDVEISIRISQKGILGVKIFADNADEQGKAHILLAVIAPELRRLGDALANLSPAKKA